MSKKHVAEHEAKQAQQHAPINALDFSLVNLNISTSIASIIVGSLAASFATGRMSWHQFHSWKSSLLKETQKARENTEKGEA